MRRDLPIRIPKVEGAVGRRGQQQALAAGNIVAVRQLVRPTAIRGGKRAGKCTAGIRVPAADALRVTAVEDGLSIPINKCVDDRNR